MKMKVMRRMANSMHLLQTVSKLQVERLISLELLESCRLFRVLGVPTTSMDLEYVNHDKRLLDGRTTAQHPSQKARWLACRCMHPIRQRQPPQLRLPLLTGRDMRMPSWDLTTLSLKRQMQRHRTFGQEVFSLELQHRENVPQASRLPQAGLLGVRSVASHRRS